MTKIVNFREVQAMRDLDIDPWTASMMRREFALQLIVRMCEDGTDLSKIRETALFGLEEDEDPTAE